MQATQQNEKNLSPNGKTTKNAQLTNKSSEEIAFSKIHKATTPLLHTSGCPWFDLESKILKTMSEDSEFAALEKEAWEDGLIDFHLEQAPDHPAALWRRKHKVDLTGWPNDPISALIFGKESVAVSLESSFFETVTLSEIKTLLKVQTITMKGTTENCFAFQTSEGNYCLIHILEHSNKVRPFKIRYRLA